MTAQQSSRLLGDLFAAIDEDERVTVLHIGAALPETVDFFSHYRCKLHFVDLFAELPLEEDPEQPSLQQRFGKWFDFPPGTRFDLVLFWDLFNYLDDRAIGALMAALRPWLLPDSRAHGFAVHNPRTATPRHETFAIAGAEALVLRPRPDTPPGYAPLPQSRLQDLLDGFRFERTVLLADSRLELLLSASL